MRDFAYSRITELFILVRGPLCRETQITPKPCFSPCFSLSCCMGGAALHDWAYSARGELVHILDNFQWWTRPFFSMACNFAYSSLMVMRILDGRVLHKGTKIALKISHFLCFLFCFLPEVYGEQKEKI